MGKPTGEIKLAEILHHELDPDQDPDPLFPMRIRIMLMRIYSTAHYHCFLLKIVKSSYKAIYSRKS